MPHSEHLKGHVTYSTIVLYFVEFSLITKSKWAEILFGLKLQLKLYYKHFSIFSRAEWQTLINWKNEKGVFYLPTSFPTE